MFSFSRWCISAPCYRFHWLVLNGDVFCQRSDGVRVNSKYDLSVSLHIRRYTGCFICILAFIDIQGVLSWYPCIQRYTGYFILILAYIHIQGVSIIFAYIYRYTGCLISSFAYIDIQTGCLISIFAYIGCLSYKIRKKEMITLFKLVSSHYFILKETLQEK